MTAEPDWAQDDAPGWSDVQTWYAGRLDPTSRLLEHVQAVAEASQATGRPQGKEKTE